MDWKVQVVKRAVDVVGAGLGLGLTAPFFPVLAAAIYLDNTGLKGKDSKTGQRLFEDARRGWSSGWLTNDLC